MGGIFGDSRKEVVQKQVENNEVNHSLTKVPETPSLETSAELPKTPVLPEVPENID